MMAEEALLRCGLDEVWFVPCARQPLKPNGPHNTPESRLESIRELIKGNPKLKLSLIDWNRQGPCYTVDWLSELTQSRPDDRFYFILGMDSVRDLPKWKAPERIFSLARPILFERPGFERPVSMPYFTQTPTILPAVSSLSSTQIRRQTRQETTQ